MDRDGPVLRVTFNRPAQRNAMTWEMYDGLARACAQARSGDGIRAMVLRGAGDRAFVAGTDIAQFLAFGTGADGVAYEARMTELARGLETVPVPTVAVIDGYCTGAGLLLAACCDLRVATGRARFGVPIARTVGNCLSMNTYSLLVRHLGAARTTDMLLRASFLTGEDAAAAGFVAELSTPDNLDAAADAVVATLLDHAPLTMRATKEALYRLRTAGMPDGDDIVAGVFSSADFQAGIRAFLAKEPPHWTGR